MSSRDLCSDLREANWQTVVSCDGAALSLVLSEGQGSCSIQKQGVEQVNPIMHDLHCSWPRHVKHFQKTAKTNQLLMANKNYMWRVSIIFIELNNVLVVN